MSEPTIPESNVYLKTPGGDPIHEPMLQHFAPAHLPPHLREVSNLFWTLAETIVKTLPRNPERTVALRKLLEAKDCAARTVTSK